jgi:hypothetical protein
MVSFFHLLFLALRKKVVLSTYALCTRISAAPIIQVAKYIYSRMIKKNSIAVPKKKTKAHNVSHFLFEWS